MLGTESKFASLLKSLEGVTILEAPRVSRETIVATLRDHTSLLRELRQEINVVNQTNKQVALEAAENRSFITQLREDSAKQQKGLDSLIRLADDLRRQVSSLTEKVEEIPPMKIQHQEQKIFVQDLATKFHVQVNQLSEFIDKTNTSIDRVDQRCNASEFHIKEIEEYINHYHENLILPASQIRVETAAGFNDHPMSLIEVLSICNTSFNKISDETVRIDQRLIGHDEQLSRKAPDSVLYQINSLEKKVAAVEFVLEREEDQGVGAVRRQCEQLTSDVHSITAELHDKIDKDAVSIMVHEKYDEIVHYLQDALQSSAEDEQNFKAKATELEEAICKIANGKCDRTEILPMQEMLIKTEAMLRKMAAEKVSNPGQSKDSKGRDVSSTYTKKEIEAMLELKVDKEIFEQQLQSIMKITKKNRRLSSVLSPSSGDSQASFDQFPMSNFMGGGPVPASMMAGHGASMGSQGVVLDPTYRDQMMWKTLADAAREENDAALLKAQIVNKMNHNPGYEPSRRADGMVIGLQTNSSEKTRKGRGSQSDAFPKQSVSKSQSEVIAIPQLNRANDRGDNISPRNRVSQLQESNRPGSSQSNVQIPSAAQRSNIQAPSSAGSDKVGLDTGSAKQPQMTSASDIQHQRQAIAKSEVFDDELPLTREMTASSEIRLASGGGHPQDLTFLGAQIAGGGFNLKTANLTKPQTLKAASGFADNSQDLEAAGFLVKGQDGKFYYTDSPTSAAPQPVVPTSKKLQPATRGSGSSQQ